MTSLIIILFQIVSFSVLAQAVEYIDNRWYKTQQGAETLAINDETNNTKVFDRNDYPALYNKVQTNLEEIYTRAKESLAPYYSNFPEQPIFILTDRDAMLPLRVDNTVKTTNILYISKRTAENDALKGVLAHELSHYILDHGRDNQQSKISQIRSILVTPQIESITLATIHAYDKKMSSSLTDVIDFTLSTSTLFKHDTQGVPFDIRESTNFLEVLMTQSILENYNEKLSCERAIDLRDTIAVDIYIKYCSYRGVQECRFPNEIREQLPQMITEFKEEARKCLNKEEDLFYNIVSNFLGEENFQELKKAFEEKDYSVFPNRKRSETLLEILFSNQNPIDRLINMHEYGVRYLENSYKDLGINIENLKLITSEDEADILAQIILDNKDSDSNTFAISRLQYMSKSEKNYCQSKVHNNIMPHHGFITNIHHSQCWRYWRSVKLRQELKENLKKDLLVKTLLNNNLQKNP